MADTETRRRPARPLPDLVDEDEVDLGRYGRALAARWWLALAGLVAGVVIGYLVSLGSGQVWQATALLYLGNPLSVGGGNVVQGLQQNPRTVGEIIHSEAAVKFAALHCGLRPGQIRGGISSKAVSGGKAAAKAGGGQLVQITVQGSGPRKAACPANLLAARVVAATSGYVDTKIDTYNERLDTVNKAIASVDRRIAILNRSVAQASSRPVLEQLVLVSYLDNAEQRRAQLVDEQGETQQLLALARDIEKPQVVERAESQKTTARSSRNSMIVGGLLGLLLGIAAALLWDPLAARFGR